MPEPKSLGVAFLDRDGTIIVDRDYTSDPDDVMLLPGAAKAITMLAAAGYPSIVITNQSGIARGLLTIAQYGAVRHRLDELLAAEGAQLRDSFACPHHPDFTGPCGCRKPETELYRRAAAMYDLDLSKCFYVGDRMRDIAPGLTFKGRSVLVQSPATRDEDVRYAAEHHAPVVFTLLDAVTLLLAGKR